MKIKGAKVEIAMCMPKLGDVAHFQTRQCMDNMIRYATNQGVKVIIEPPVASSSTPQNRRRLVERMTGDWILFVDSDMVFPPQSLVRLLSHDVDIVSGVAVRAYPPYWPTHGYFRPDGSIKPLITNEPSLLRDGDGDPYRQWLECHRRLVNQELEDITPGGVGFGLVMVKADVFRDKVPFPWFTIGRNPVYQLFEDDQTYTGRDIKRKVLGQRLKDNPSVLANDYAFCLEACLAGCRVFVDWGIITGHASETFVNIYNALQEHGIKYEYFTRMTPEERSLMGAYNVNDAVGEAQSA